MKNIKWLHLTDIHLGMSNQSYLISKFKKNLFEDLKKSHDLSGPWDILFFTGDLAQKGTSEEFKSVNLFMDELLGHLKILGSNPLLLTVPGNHDLYRPNKNSPVVKALKSWNTDEDIRDDFWENTESEYRKTIETSLDSYSNWFNKLDLTSDPTFIKGILPGDFSCILNIRGLRIGIIGLNTTFLQLDGSDYVGKLSLDTRQFNKVCDDLITWDNKTDISILLTHHDSSWLNSRSRKSFDAEIAPPGMFHAHFCGHLHLPNTKIEAIVGSKSKSTRIGASLFGMEKYNDEFDRIHGYSSGIIELEFGIGKEIIWPRIMTKKYSGELLLGPDLGYELLEDNSIVYDFEYKANIISESENNLNQIKKSSVFNSNENILDIGNRKVDHASKIKTFPKYKLQNLPQHNSVRKVEQANFEHLIRKNRYVWVFADWGLGFDGFLSSASTKMGLSNENINIFNLLCEDVSSVNGISLIFQKQYNCSLEEFCQLISTDTKESILIFNQISSSIKTDHELKEINDLIKLILDYCPKTSIVITARQHNSHINEFVTIRALDMPQVKTYITNHSESDYELNNLSVIENLFRSTGGLPMHLDRIIDNLKFSSIQELLQEESELEQSERFFSEPIPKALQESVLYISSKEDKISKRSFTLLKLLSILENGQTLSSIKRYDHTKPFYTENAVQLSKLSLLDSIQLTDIEPNLDSFKKGDVKKILKVPKQVRDYVKTLISNDELTDILKKSATCLFGPKWREGNIKSSSNSPLSKKQINTGVDNELILIRLLLIKALKDNIELDVKRAFNMTYNYCSKLFKNVNYHDSRIGAEELYHMFKVTHYHEELLKVKILYAKSIRMDSIADSNDAINHFEEILILSKFEPTKKQLSTIHLNLALAYDNIKNSKKAIFNAEKVIELDSSENTVMQAETVIVSNKYKNIKKLSELRKIEKKARKKEFYTVANNILYNLARNHAKDNTDAIKQFDKIIKTKTDVNNIIWSVIQKAKLYLDNHQLSKITSEDRLQLNYCYTYLFYQRTNYIFSICHEVIWKILMTENQLSELLQMFRYSSFVWRLTDKEDLEIDYLKKMNNLNLSCIENSNKSIDILNLEYFTRRKEEFKSISTLVPTSENLDKTI